MSKRWFVVVAMIFVASALFADNPPAGGQNMYRFVSPSTMTSASVCGGAIPNIAPTTVTENPALSAYEQRAILDLGGTALVNNADYNSDKIGGAFQIGVLIPTRLFMYTADLQGIFVPFYNMHVGKTITLTGSISKDITDKLSIGLGVRGGVLFDDGNDWTLTADIGAFYNWGDLAFMKNFRFAAVVKHLGKVFTDAEVVGMEWKASRSSDMYPAIATLKVGAAATMFENNVFNLGTSLDLAVPSFYNGLIVDVGVMARVKVGSICLIGLQSDWQFDLKETIFAEKLNLIPTVGLSAKFIINAKSSEFMTNKGWEQSEVAVHTSWANLYKDTNAFSFQGIINLGMKDEEKPVIYLWDEEYNDND